MSHESCPKIQRFYFDWCQSIKPMLRVVFKTSQFKYHNLLGVLTTGSNTTLWLKTSASVVAPLLSPAPSPPLQDKDHTLLIICLALTKSAIDTVAETTNKGESCTNRLFLLCEKASLSSALGEMCARRRGMRQWKEVEEKGETVPLTSTSLTFFQLTFYTWKGGWERKRKHECSRRGRQRGKNDQRKGETGKMFPVMLRHFSASL